MLLSSCLCGVWTLDGFLWVGFLHQIRWGFRDFLQKKNALSFLVGLGCGGMSKFPANAHRLSRLCYTGLLYDANDDEYERCDARCRTLQTQWKRGPVFRHPGCFWSGFCSILYVFADVVTKICLPLYHHIYTSNSPTGADFKAFAACWLLFGLALQIVKIYENMYTI